MKSRLLLVLGTALLASAPALATPGWDEPSNSALPQAEMSYGAIVPPSPGERRQIQAAAERPSPNGAANVIPNGPTTANPPGAGASSQATLTEHGEQGRP
ncbi:MAG TPA: hypothetical protein VG501_08980 [Rhizomicrobium sp.]|nr:hypothetical protein [Rhizomicrobium sp.]